MIALVSLGSNLFDQDFSPSETIGKALSLFKGEELEILGVSKIYSSPAFPAGSGPDFTNGVVKVSSNLPSGEILAALHRIEIQFGRTREKRWAPRILDLDLIAVEDRIAPDAQTLRHWIDLPLADQKTDMPQELLLPHPRIQDRAFVLKPLCDVAPEWVHPMLGLTATQMLHQLPIEDLNQVKALNEVVR